MARPSVFTNLQPKDRETILHCGHIKRKGMKHFFKSSGTQFTRPDGTTGEAQWWVCCQRCFDRYHGDFQVRGDATWIGDEPFIEQNPNVN